MRSQHCSKVTDFLSLVFELTAMDIFCCSQQVWKQMLTVHFCASHNEIYNLFTKSAFGLSFSLVSLSNEKKCQNGMRWLFPSLFSLFSLLSYSFTLVRKFSLSLFAVKLLFYRASYVFTSSFCSFLCKITFLPWYVCFPSLSSLSYYCSTSFCSFLCIISFLSRSVCFFYLFSLSNYSSTMLLWFFLSLSFLFF